MKILKAIYWAMFALAISAIAAFSDTTTEKDGRINVTNGVNGINGKDGINGRDGKDGNNGKDGKDGTDGETKVIYVPQEPITSMPQQVEPPVVDQPSDDWSDNSINTGQGGSVTHIVVTENDHDKPLNFEIVS